MDEVVDLFGDPVPEGWGRRGRPAHIPTQQNRCKVSMLLAMGWSNERIANALAVTAPTLRKHYFRELKLRGLARDRLDARLAMLLWAQFEAGNVAAGKEFVRLLERNDLMLYGGGAPAKTPPLGKKEQALADAQAPNPDSTLGELMMRRHGHESRTAH